MKYTKTPLDEGCVLVEVSESGRCVASEVVDNEDAARYDAEPWRWSELVNRLYRKALASYRRSVWDYIITNQPG